MKLSKPQADAVRLIVAAVRREGTSARVGYGPGAEIPRGVAHKLAEMGLVQLHVGEPTARPAKAGFGHARNWKTVLSENVWLTAGPELLAALRARSSMKENPRKKGVLAALAAVPADVKKAALTAHKALKEQGIPHLVAGGIAVGARGYPRSTKDADFLVSDEAFVLTSRGLVAGMKPGIPFPGVGRIPVDYLSPNGAEERKALERARSAKNLRAVPVEILVRMKLSAGRARDEGDVVEILKAGAPRKRIRSFLNRTAPGLVAEFDRLAERADREAR